MSNIPFLMRRAAWSKSALLAFVVGLIPAACSAEQPLLSADLSTQLAQGDAVVQAPPPISSPYGAYLAGLVARGDGDLEAAADYLLQALTYDPDNPELLFPAMHLAAATGRQEETVSLASRILEVEPQHSIASLVLAVDAARQGDLAGAEARLTALPQRGFDQVLVPMLMAWIKIGQGDVDGGLQALSVLQGEGGTGVLYSVHAALINEVAGRSELAAQEYEALLAKTQQPTLRITWLAGSFFERHGQRERALALYREFVNDAPGADILAPMLERAEQGGESPVEVANATDGMAEVLFNLSGLLSQEQADDIALIHLHQALALKPDFMLAQVLLGEILQKQQRSHEAIAAYRRIPQDSPFGWIVGLRVAEELQVVGETEAALSEFDRLAAERPDAYEPLSRKGNLLREEERFGEAVDAYDGAVERLERRGEIEPRHWSLLYFRGIALERSDQWERAEADFKHALGLQPDQPYVMNYLAYSWVEKKQNLDEAEAMLERAVKLRPRDGYIVDSLGWVYYRLGRYEEAVVQLERAVELRPQDPTINDHLGDALWQVGRKNEARFQWHRALSLDPEEDQVPLIEDKIKKGVTVAPKDI
ncbi:tetratricopeptide repeat protein [Pelagibius sp. 7325]|uniref:tetratricopeptide repeat protein n=1 Tax=Pelagibius sp. 7325 TaxID=3131994 RepID=UPI0030EBBA3F